MRSSEGAFTMELVFFKTKLFLSVPTMLYYIFSRKLTTAAPKPWPDSPQNYEKIPFLFLSHLVYGIFL